MMNATHIGQVFDANEYEELESGINKESKYHEKEIVEGLTLYDIHRKPQTLITDPKATIELNLEELNSDLTCPVCLSILQETSTAPLCLHRFCANCITTSIRVTNKECPSCRIKIASKRTLRPDLNFDELIRSIYPNLKKFEDEKEKKIAQQNRSQLFHSAYTSGCKKGMEEQLSKRRSKKRVVQEDDSEADEEEEEEEELLDFTLARDPFEFKIPKLPRGQLRCSYNVTIGHLKLYLMEKLSIQAVNIFILENNERVILDPTSTLRQITNKYPKTEQELQLWFNQ